MPRSPLVVLFVVALGLLLVAAEPKTIYISVNGSIDASNCGNASDPCALAVANAAADPPTAGDTFLFYDGVYNITTGIPSPFPSKFPLFFFGNISYYSLLGHSSIFDLNLCSVTFASVADPNVSNVVFLSRVTIYEPLFKVASSCVGRESRITFKGLTFADMPSLASSTVVVTSVLHSVTFVTFINCTWRDLTFYYIQNGDYNDLSYYGSVIDIRVYGASFQGCTLERMYVLSDNARVRGAALSAKICSGFEMVDCLVQNNTVRIFGLTGDGTGIMVEAICEVSNILHSLWF